MVESKFLKKEDVGRGTLATIQKCVRYNVALSGAPQELKWCLEFAELDKPLVLNVTNMRLLESITGSDDTDNWIGCKVVLYDDPTIMYAGKVTGGIRVRAPRPGAVPPDAEDQTRKDTSAVSGNPVPPVSDDDIPF
jgi:hypothetical protein